MLAESLVFLAGKRTPFGTYGGAFKEVLPTDLALAAAKAAMEEAGLLPSEIDHIIFGNVLASSPDSIYIPRHIGLRSGVPLEIPALGVNRLCGTGFQVIVEAFHQILAGDSKVALVGGVENMSMTPYAVRNVRWGVKMGDAPLSDVLLEGLHDTYAQIPMAVTAENLAVEYGISREMADRFALRSQLRCREAVQAGRFDGEIVPFSWVDKRGKAIVVSKDEHPKPETEIEVLRKLKPVFKSDGVVTAGNASGIVDGAAALVVASESFARKKALKPLGRLVSYGITGCDPKIMGIGPVSAAKEALRRAGKKLGDMDLIEVNEAFAPQALAVAKELGIPEEIFNVDGGAIAIGHPLAASGTRIILHLLAELRRRRKKWGLGSACIGGGQGIALVVEAFV